MASKLADEIDRRRLARLAVVQRELETIWTQIESRDWMSPAYLMDPVMLKLQDQQRRLEEEERSLLRPGRLTKEAETRQLGVADASGGDDACTVDE